MRAGRYVVGTLYRAGPGGVVITWADGTTRTYSAREQVYLKHQPRRIEGRLYRRRGSVLEYEAPALVPER